MKVEIEDILEARNILWRINARWNNLEDIEWYYDGKKVEVTEEEIEEWKFTGLDNTDFGETYLLDRIHKEEEDNESV